MRKLLLVLVLVGWTGAQASTIDGLHYTVCELVNVECQYQGDNLARRTFYLLDPRMSLLVLDAGGRRFDLREATVTTPSLVFAVGSDGSSANFDDDASGRYTFDWHGITSAAFYTGYQGGSSVPIEALDVVFQAPAAVPEPATLALVLLGLGVAAVRVRP